MIRAVRQCRRGRKSVPIVKRAELFETVLADAEWTGASARFYLDDRAAKNSGSVSLPARRPTGEGIEVALAIGPEGGFTDRERRDDQRTRARSRCDSGAACCARRRRCWSDSRCCSINSGIWPLRSSDGRPLAGRPRVVEARRRGRMKRAKRPTRRKRPVFVPRLLLSATFVGVVPACVTGCSRKPMMQLFGVAATCFNDPQLCPDAAADRVQLTVAATCFLAIRLRRVVVPDGSAN